MKSLDGSPSSRGLPIKKYDLTQRITSIGKESSAKIRLRGFFAPKFAAFVNRGEEGYFISPASGKELRINGEVVSGKYEDFRTEISFRWQELK